VKTVLEVLEVDYPTSGVSTQRASFIPNRNIQAATSLVRGQSLYNLIENRSQNIINFAHPQDISSEWQQMGFEPCPRQSEAYSGVWIVRGSVKK